MSAPRCPQPTGNYLTAADRAAAATRDRLGVAEVLRPAAAAGRPPAVASAPFRDLVLHLVPARVLALVLALSPGDEVPARVLPSRPFAK